MVGFIRSTLAVGLTKCAVTRGPVRSIALATTQTVLAAKQQMLDSGRRLVR